LCGGESSLSGFYYEYSQYVFQADIGYELSVLSLACGRIHFWIGLDGRKKRPIPCRRVTDGL
jgi:hypothetical protein